MTRRALLAGGVGLAGLGAYAHWIEPTWIDVRRLDLPVPGLPRAWEGARVGLMSDLHRGPRVPQDYLARVVDRLAGLNCDLVALAGDFVTGREGSHAQDVASLMTRLSPALGVFACLGNHDYGVVRPTPDAEPLSVAEELASRGVRLLRNGAVRLVRGGKPLWVVGVEDRWSGRLDAKAAMQAVPAKEASLGLCHNPDSADDVAEAGCGAILAGHTHGGQVRIPFVGPLIVPIKNKRRAEGLHRVREAWLYVTRGVGWLHRVRFNCRPEIAVLTLRRSADRSERPPGRTS